MSSRSLLNKAVRLLESGLSIIPIRLDGTKAPAVRWKRYQTRRATPKDLDGWFKQPHGIGIVCGRISGHLEVLDFDGPMEGWQDLVREMGCGSLVDKLPLVKTPSGGYHVYYRSPEEIEGNQKLAQTAGGDGDSPSRVLIETRGEGGYVLAPESPPECHPANKPHQLIRGDLTRIPDIAADERKLLLECARALNEYVESNWIVRGPVSEGSQRPGDDFNRRASWKDILEEPGWSQVGGQGPKIYWCRPSKTGGVSATTNFQGSDFLCVFSTNAPPFDANTAYSKFAAYTLLNHDGDFSQAAADLAEKGYGGSVGGSFYASYAPQSTSWPRPLAEPVFYGIVGKLVREIEPHTEADPAALLVQLLTALGSVLGRVAYFLVEADRPSHQPLLHGCGRHCKGAKRHFLGARSSHAQGGG